MAQIARAAELAKGTLYLYFPSKEELFLQLTIDALLGWMLKLGGELSPGAGIEPLSRRIAETFVERPQLARLLALMHSVLEQNITVETALRFKRALVSLLVLSAQAIELIAELQPGEGTRFLLRLHAVMVGLSQMCDPSAPVAEARARSQEIEVLFIDLGEELRVVAKMLLEGAASSART